MLSTVGGSEGVLLRTRQEHTLSQESPGPQQPAATWPTAPSWTGPASTRPAALSPRDAARSRRWRIILGCSALVLALFSGFYGYLNWTSVARTTRAIQAAGGFVPESAMAAAIAIVAAFCVLAVCYAGVGVWNLAARNSTAKAPLIAAIVLAAVAIVLVVLYTVSRPTGVTQIGGFALNVLIMVRSAVILRMKTGPAASAG